MIYKINNRHLNIFSVYDIIFNKIRKEFDEMSIVFDYKTQRITDERCKSRDLIDKNGISVCYTLISDDITKGEKPASTPYNDRSEGFDSSEGELFAPSARAHLRVTPFYDGLRFDMQAEREDLSELGINLPLNFMGKLDGGGWENQLLFNSPYTSPDKSIIYAYLTCPNGYNIAVCVLGEADGWKMDYSPYSFGHYFVNLKLLANYDRAYKTGSKRKKLSFAIIPVSDFNDCLARLSEIYGVPFLDYDISGAQIGDQIKLIQYGSPDELIEIYDSAERKMKFSSEYTVNKEGEVSIIPVKNGKRGAPVTVYGYKSLVELYKKAMDSVDLEIINTYTDKNLCEHQCWVSAMLRFLRRYGDRLSERERSSYIKKTHTLLDIITETDEKKAIPRITILNKPHDAFPAYNVYKSMRVQELFFGITILLDAYRAFGDEKYYTYAVGATDTLISHYQKDDGRIEVDWGGGSYEDYTTVCSPMIPLVDMANFLKDRDTCRSKRYFEAADRMAEYLFGRGMIFPTEGGKSSLVEEEMEDGSISCTALSLLYYCKNAKRNEEYIKKAKQILDVHSAWVIKTPVCQMHASTLRWWETQWEGDADGPAICAGHAWTVWRAEADHLYYELTGDAEYLKKAKNGFMTNLSKIRRDGKMYSIYNPDEINGGGFNSRSDNVRFRIAQRFSDIEDCGISRYVFIRLNDTFLKD